MRVAVLLVVGALLTSGCLGLGGDEASPTDDESVTRTRAEVKEDKAAIQGVVTDNAVNPVEGATVTILELELTTKTAPNGGFFFEDLKSGRYSLTVESPGYVSASDEVQTKRGDVVLVDFILIRLVSNLPYTQEMEHNGFMQYGWGLGHNATGDEFWILDSNCDYDEIASQGCRGEFQLDAPLETLVFEMFWDASGPLATHLSTMLRVSDNAAVVTGGTAVFQAEGPSPLDVRMDRAQLDAVLTGWADRCLDGEQEYCGMSFRHEGWPLQTRVWPSWQCVAEQGGACALLEQTYTQYMTAFYNAPAPPGYKLRTTAVVPGPGSAVDASPGLGLDLPV